MSGLILAPPPSSAGAAINTINEAMSHHSKTDAANIRIMAAAIIVLFSVVLFIIALHLYAKCFWKNALRSHRRPEQGLDYEIHEALEAEQSRGLEKAVIESLPTFTYSAESMPKGLECAVCLCEFDENEKARFLPKCSHVFHTECIDMWFKSHSTCPLCRLRLTIVPTKKADNTLACSTAAPIDFSTFDITFISSHDPLQVRHENRDLCALQQDEINPIDQHERLPLPSAAESKYLNKQQGLQEASVMAPLHLAIDLPRPSCESACGSCSGHSFSSTALCHKSLLSRFSLRRILSRDRKVAPSAATSADYDEEGSFPASSYHCHPLAL